MQEAIAQNIFQASAMILSTVSKSGKPSSRVVLLKAVDVDEFVFYTNYNSRKAQDLAQNPHATLLFYWPELERQIRVEGLVNKVSRETSKQYFSTRPRESQIGAWASPQSKVVSARQDLEDNYAVVKEKYLGQEVPCPPHWGGYALKPSQIEFWQCRSNRLHDRFCFKREQYGPWQVSRLAP